MVFSELPVGSEFHFGSTTQRTYRNGRNSTVEVPFVWMKTGLNGLSVCIDNKPYVSFDYARRETGNNRYERIHGHRAFFLSSLCKYLNCADESWKQVAAGDGIPYAEHDQGFLSHFTQDELSFMMPYSMTTPMPVGYTKTYGASMTRDVLVGIPSIEQLSSDGFSRGTFGVDLYPETWVLNADTMSMFMRRGSSRTGGDNARKVMPVIKIKDDAPVDRDPNGKFIIRVPETEFDGDLAAFLGFELAA